MKKARHFIIHGHFYQPPRENPWTDSIELQESAAPDHDWNDRISRQCYEPNGASRILDAYGRIEDIVNNYEWMSFNIGPTLLSWIRRERPRAYQRILKADRDSAARLGGHGNAIAQAYNHMILPLASPEDRLTQIRWGAKDFEFHFGRKPESMWLAETAIDMNTVVDLIHEGIRFVILSPTQAADFRPLEGGEWVDVGGSDINTTRAYRIFPKDEDGNAICEGFLDVFFYHGSLSSAVGFEHLLRDSSNFADRILDAFEECTEQVPLISVATDGESYGHHEPFGDMCAAFLFRRLASKKGLLPVNYGWFLERHPPVHEVRIKNAHGEGCAWSCAHGTGRWSRDCGCSTGGSEEWNQEWREHVRRAFDELKQDADHVFEMEATLRCQKDPWELRDEYVEVLLREDHGFTHKFLDRAGASEDPKARRELVRLLEMQKFAMFMYTSCGWFFADISGIEPVQNMKYARRVMELIRPFCDKFPERRFLSTMSRAKGNIDEDTGKSVYLRDAVPSVQPVHRLMAEAVFQVADDVASHYEMDLHGYHVKLDICDKNENAVLFHVEAVSQVTQEEGSNMALLLGAPHGKRQLLILPGVLQFAELDMALLSSFSIEEITELYPGTDLLELKDLFPDGRVSIARNLVRKSFRAVCTDFREFPERHGMLTSLLQSGALPLPDYIRVPLGMSLTAEAHDLLHEILVAGGDKRLQKCESLKAYAGELGVVLSMDYIQEEYAQRLDDLVGHLDESADSTKLERVMELISAADIFEMNIDKTELENAVFSIYERFVSSLRRGEHDMDRFVRFFDWLNFRTEFSVQQKD